MMMCVLVLCSCALRMTVFMGTRCGSQQQICAQCPCRAHAGRSCAHAGPSSAFQVHGDQRAVPHPPLRAAAQALVSLAVPLGPLQLRAAHAQSHSTGYASVPGPTSGPWLRGVCFVWALFVGPPLREGCGDARRFGVDCVVDVLQCGAHAMCGRPPGFRSGPALTVPSLGSRNPRPSGIDPFGGDVCQSHYNFHNTTYDHSFGGGAPDAAL